MPLTKKASTVTLENVANAITTAHQEDLKAVNSQPTQPAPTRAPAERKTSLTKDDYWRRREERDIRTGECMRLSGVLQALLGSVNFGQFCTVADKDAYLSHVEEASLRLAKFVTEKA